MSHVFFCYKYITQVLIAWIHFAFSFIFVTLLKKAFGNLDHILYIVVVDLFLFESYNIQQIVNSLFYVIIFFFISDWFSTTPITTNHIEPGGVLTSAHFSWIFLLLCCSGEVLILTFHLCFYVFFPFLQKRCAPLLNFFYFLTFFTLATLSFFAFIVFPNNFTFKVGLCFLSCT